MLESIGIFLIRPNALLALLANISHSQGKPVVSYVGLANIKKI